MGLGVLLRTDFTACGLRWIATRCTDNRQIRRLLALAAVYDGMNRAEAMRVGAMDRQTLRDWVHRFNEFGPDGLTNAKGAGRPRLLDEAQMQELAQIVETGPDREVDGIVGWRRIDLARVMEQRFGVHCSQSVIAKYLGELGFSNISGRPQPPKQDGQVIEAFKKTGHL